MCRTWAITYLCGHTCPFRLSTCLGHHNHHRHQKGHCPDNNESDINVRPSCSSVASLTFMSTACCGPCSKEDAETRLKEEWSHLRARLAVRARRASVDQNVAPPPEGELERREAEFERRLWMLGKEFPDGKAKRWRRPGGAAKRRESGSPLKGEVQREDVVVEDGWEAYGWGKDGSAIDDGEGDEEVEQGDGNENEDREQFTSADGFLSHSSIDQNGENDPALPEGKGYSVEDKPAPREHGALPQSVDHALSTTSSPTSLSLKNDIQTKVTAGLLLRMRDSKDSVRKPQDFGRPLNRCRVPNLVELTIGT